MELKLLQNAVNTNVEHMTSMMREAELLYSEIPKNEQQTDINNSEWQQRKFGSNQKSSKRYKPI